MFVNHSKSLKLAVLKAYYTPQFSKRQIREIFGVSLQSIYRWVKQFPNLDRKTYCRKKQLKLNEELQKYIARRITLKKVWKMNKLLKTIKRKFNCWISRSSIYKCLKKHKITHKRISYRTKKTDETKLQVFKEKLNTINKKNIISLDECSFDSHIHPLYGWSKKGEKCLYINKSQKGRTRFSLLMAISNKRIIGWKLIPNSYNKLRFIEFLESELIPNISHLSKPVILMDNVAFHHSKEVKKVLTENLIDIIYNPPYHPESNPIELVFAKLKNTIRKDPPSTPYQLIKRLIKIIYTNLETKFFGNIYQSVFGNFLKSKIPS
jgi:transposase